MKRIGVLALLLGLHALAWGQTRTYLAIGDSVAYGFQPNDYNPSYGDKGYVKLYADWLKTQQGGVRPRVINVAIPGESTSSYYDDSEVGRLLNLNYFLNSYSQREMVDRRIQQEKQANRTVTHVTFALGANDLIDLQSSAFFDKPFEEQRALVDAALAAARPRLDAVITQVKTQLPATRILVPGYYNPYNAFPGSPEDRIADYGIPKLNALLASAAKRHRATFVPVYGYFIGQEGSLTWILEGDIHPRNAGYAVFSQRLSAAPPANVYALP
ncbi:MAG: hypothetical protein HONBIEJF_01593 [Fimbriimonadaceae bacterium]|nr:hypothetical protein [Fimbriimonadaceae bacterium]